MVHFVCFNVDSYIYFHRIAIIFLKSGQAGYSSLNMACDNLHVECTKLLLAIPGIDVNVQNEVS